MSTLTTSLTLSIIPTLNTDSIGSLAPQIANMVSSLASGTSEGQADRLYTSRRSAVNPTPDTLDVAGGSLLQPDQTAFSIAEIVMLVVVNRSTAATLTVGGGSNPVLDIDMKIKPAVSATVPSIGILFSPANPAYPVTAGTGDIISVASSSGTAAYDIMIIGRSA